MAALFKFSKSFLLRILLLSFGLSTAVFYLAYQQDMAQVAQVTQVTSSYLKYIRGMKDDMGLIDWAKELENLGGVVAFKLAAGPKTLAQGGNQAYLSDSLPGGIHYSFPSDWTIHLAYNKNPQIPEGFTLIVKTWPGPGLWGLLAFIAVWIVGTALYSLTPRSSKIIPSPSSLNSSERPSPAS